MECPICSQTIAGDLAYFQYHTNQCLDSPNISITTSTSSSLAHSATLASQARTPAVTPFRPAPVSPPAISSNDNNEPEIICDDDDGDDPYCPICLTLFSTLGVEPGERELHANQCATGAFGGAEPIANDDHADWLDIPEEGKGGTAGSRGRDGEQFVINQGLVEPKKAVQGVPRLIPLLSQLLTRSHAEGKTRLAVLCSGDIEHVERKLGDFGWGCGYKNAQMLYSSLRHLDSYSTSALRESIASSSVASTSNTTASTGTDFLLAPSALLPIPTINEFQCLLEEAWRHGYDPSGAAHFNHKLRGSRKWIGTTEVYTAFSYLGIQATIVDFPQQKKERGVTGVHTALIAWIKNYFLTPDVDSTTLSSSTSSTSQTSPTTSRTTPLKRSSSSPTTPPANALSTVINSQGSAIRKTRKQPLYLQHQGHSRTVVGFEETTTGRDWLIMFDPGNATSKAMRTAAGLTSSSSSPNPTKRSKSNYSSSSSSSKASPSAASTTTEKLSTNPAYTAFFDSLQPGPGFGRSHGGGGQSSSSGGVIEGGSRGGEKLDCKDYVKLLEPYRVSLSKLGKNEEYQILYVEDKPLLNIEERSKRKMVKSTTVTS